jgi:DNA-binding transcriptional ArsR family regulator
MFKALAHPVRLQIACALREGEACVCHLEALLGRRQSYISQHLMVLRQARVLTERRQGAFIFYRLAPGPAARVLLALEKPAEGERPAKSRTTPRHCVCPHCREQAGR